MSDSLIDRSQPPRASRLTQLMDGPLGVGEITVTGLKEHLLRPMVLDAHTHPDGQLVYAATGVMVVGSDVGYWVVPPTRALWLSPGVRHWARTSGDVQLRSVMFASDSSAPVLAGSCVLAVTPLMREVINVLADKTTGTEMSARDSALTAVLIHELQELPVLPVHLPSLRESRLSIIERHVLERPHDYVPLDNWAQKLNVDKRTLHRLFVRQTGMSYRNWLQQAHLLLALEWLADGQKVIDVAAGLGYNSQSAFTVMFRRNLGTTPAAFFSNAVSRATS
ncbi:helix-turn-helix domain protein [Burkholderia gladioli]|uniref:Helix-turn-helix domain protein n=3 Tax=Burkholderia gladioli TaxID=28095 RepID=A0AAW3FBL5_BURGA|nr:helix-turn-helix domain protein [Burkholderia gladioli]